MTRRDTSRANELTVNTGELDGVTVTSFENLSDVPAYAGNGSRILRIAATEDGVEVAPATTQELMTDMPSSLLVGDVGKALVVNAAHDGYELGTVEVGASTGLSDMPNAIGGAPNAGKVLKVNAGGTAYDIGAVPVTASTGLTDMPASLTGLGLIHPRVNAGGTAYELSKTGFVQSYRLTIPAAPNDNPAIFDFTNAGLLDYANTSYMVQITCENTSVTVDQSTIAATGFSILGGAENDVVHILTIGTLP